MQLRDFLSFYHSNPLIISKHHYASSFMEDFYDRQCTMFRQWCEGVVPSASTITVETTVDIIENDQLFKIITEVSGAGLHDIDITITDHDIIIKGEKEPVMETSSDDYLLHERPTGFFERTIRLPEQADMTRAVATLSRGLLIIDVPKLAEAQGSRKLIIEKTPEPVEKISIKHAA